MDEINKDTLKLLGLMYCCKCKKCIKPIRNRNFGTKLTCPNQTLDFHYLQCNTCGGNYAIQGSIDKCEHG